MPIGCGSDRIGVRWGAGSATGIVVAGCGSSKSGRGPTPGRVETVAFGVTRKIAPFVPTRRMWREFRLFRAEGTAADVEFDGQVDPMSSVWRLPATRATSGVERTTRSSSQNPEKKSGDLKMKWTTLTAALAIAFSAASANAGLFGHHKHDCCAPAPSCCAPAAPSCAAPCGPACAPECAAPAPACCAPAAPACCAPAPAACCAPSSCCNNGCGSGGCFGWFKKLFRGGSCGHKSSCCAAAPTCCAPAPSCCAPAAPTCAAPCGACN